MAFSDGMLAISKVLKFMAVGLATAAVGTGFYAWFFTPSGFGAYAACLAVGLFLFLLFWMPAWVIKKFFE